MKNILIVLYFVVIPLGLGFCQDADLGFSQDNIYGDYLLANVKKTVSLDLEGANLLDVLKMLSQQTGLNFISTESVKQRSLTLYLENIPLKQAMDVIFEANDLAYDYYLESNIFVVRETGKPAIELITKIYPLEHILVSNSPIKGHKAANSAIKSSIEKVMTSSGALVEDPLTNSLVVTDIPSQFPAIEALIKKMDVLISKVMIEVEILDVSRSLVDKLGIAWSEGISGTFTIFTRAAFHKSLLPYGKTTADFTSVEPVLKLLHTDSRTKILARPKILTLSGEEAEIKIVTDEVVGTTRAEDAETNTVTITAERVETGVNLKVIPFVNLKTDDITISLAPSVKSATDSEFKDAQNQHFKNINETITKSLVKLKDGQTLLIGGLIKRSDANLKGSVPFFSNFPILGAFFRDKSTTDIDRELLVFLTPHIVRDKPLLPKEDKIYGRGLLKKEIVKLSLDRFSKEK